MNSRDLWGVHVMGRSQIHVAARCCALLRCAGKTLFVLLPAPRSAAQRSVCVNGALDDTNGVQHNVLCYCAVRQKKRNQLSFVCIFLVLDRNW